MMHTHTHECWWREQWRLGRPVRQVATVVQVMLVMVAWVSDGPDAALWATVVGLVPACCFAVASRDP